MNRLAGSIKAATLLPETAMSGPSQLQASGAREAVFRMLTSAISSSERHKLCRFGSASVVKQASAINFQDATSRSATVSEKLHIKIEFPSTLTRIRGRIWHRDGL